MVHDEWIILYLVLVETNIYFNIFHINLNCLHFINFVNFYFSSFFVYLNKKLNKLLKKNINFNYITLLYVY